APGARLLHLRAPPEDDQGTLVALDDPFQCLSHRRPGCEPLENLVDRRRLSHEPQAIRSNGMWTLEEAGVVEGPPQTEIPTSVGSDDPLQAHPFGFLAAARVVGDLAHL